VLKYLKLGYIIIVLTASTRLQLYPHWNRYSSSCFPSDCIYCELSKRKM